MLNMGGEGFGCFDGFDPRDLHEGHERARHATAPPPAVGALEAGAMDAAAVETLRPRPACACGRAAVADDGERCTLCVYDEVNGAARCEAEGCAQAAPTVPTPRPTPVEAYRAAWSEVLRLADAEGVARQRARALWDELTPEERGEVPGGAL